MSYPVVLLNSPQHFSTNKIQHCEVRPTLVFEFHEMNSVIKLKSMLLDYVVVDYELFCV